jgi:biopolymer transport protein ExbD
MPKMKMHRKSTSIDMTAMCDVAFLLLSFFIFTAKFKKSEEIAIVTPNSVSTDSLAMMNKFNIYCNVSPEGNVLLGLENDSLMREYAKLLNSTKQIGLTDAEVEAFGTKTSVGMPLKDLKGYLTNVNNKVVDLKQTGIPVKDSATNELGDWIEATKFIFQNLKAKNPLIEYNIFVKGDQKTPYEVIDKLMLTFFKKGFDQFKMITTPKDVPVGSSLYISNKAEKELSATKK